MRKRQVGIFLTIIFGILFLTHLVIYEAVVLVWPSLPLSIFWLVPGLPVLFLCAQILTIWVNNILSRVYYRTMAVWIGSTLYLFLAAVVLGLTSLIPGVNLWIWGQILFALAIVTAVYGVVHSQIIKIVAIDIHLGNLPAAWANHKFVFVSDLHLGQVRGQGFAARITKRINTLKPEAVFIGGDLYDGVKADNYAIIEPLKHIVAPQGVYFITGNHDGFTSKSADEDVQAVAASGIKVLRDSQININGLNFIGVDYRNSANRENFAKVLSQLNIDRTKPNILIKHVPDNVDIAANAGIALQFSGHTHRAQAWPLQFVPRLVYKGFNYGLKKLAAMQIYTSSGVGTWGPPIRVGTNSEIVLVTLK